MYTQRPQQQQQQHLFIFCIFYPRAEQSPRQQQTSRSLARSLRRSLGRSVWPQIKRFHFISSSSWFKFSHFEASRVELNPFGLFVRNNAVSQSVALNDGLLSSDDGFV